MVSEPVSLMVSGTGGKGKSFQMMKTYFELTPQVMYLAKLDKEKGQADQAFAKYILDSWIKLNKEQERMWNEQRSEPQNEPVDVAPEPVKPPKPKKARIPRKKKTEPEPPKKRDKWETVKV